MHQSGHFPDEIVAIQTGILLAERAEILAQEKLLAFQRQKHILLVARNLHQTRFDQAMGTVQQSPPFTEPCPAGLIHVLQCPHDIRMALPIVIHEVVADFIEQSPCRKRSYRRLGLFHQGHPGILLFGRFQKLEEFLRLHLVILDMGIDQFAEIVAVEARLLGMFFPSFYLPVFQDTVDDMIRHNEILADQLAFAHIRLHHQALAYQRFQCWNIFHDVQIRAREITCQIVQITGPPGAAFFKQGGEQDGLPFAFQAQGKHKRVQYFRNLFSTKTL